MGILSFIKGKLSTWADEKPREASQGAALSSGFPAPAGEEEEEKVRHVAKSHHLPTQVRGGLVLPPPGVNQHNYNITSAKVLLIGHESRETTAPSPTSPAYHAPNFPKATDQAPPQSVQLTKQTPSPLASTNEPPYQGSHCEMFTKTQAMVMALSNAERMANAERRPPSRVEESPAAPTPAQTPAVPYADSHCQMFTETQAKVLAVSEKIRQENAVEAKETHPETPLVTEKESPAKTTPPAAQGGKETPQAPEHPAHAVEESEGEFSRIALFEITMASNLVGSFREKRPTGEALSTNKTRRLSSEHSSVAAPVPAALTPIAQYALTVARYH